MAQSRLQQFAGGFDRIFGIVFSSHRGKPDQETYRLLLAALDLPGRACVMVDDLAVNLIPAHELGMTTVLIGAEAPPWVDHRLDTIYDLEQALLKGP